MEEVNLETNEIKLTLGDWLYNAGIVGFLNVLKHSGDESKYRLDGQNAYFNIEVLEGFEDKYFKYLIDTYEKTMVYSTIKKQIEQLINLYNQENINEKEIEDLTKKLKDKLKNSAYEELRNNIEVNDIKKIASNNKKSNLEILNQINKYLLDNNNKRKIVKKEAIGYYDQKKKKSLMPNAVLDKYLNTNMLNLNENVQFVNNYYGQEKGRFELNCFICNNSIDKIETGLSFLLNMYFDTKRKTSHMWNFISDVDICPICKLIYQCVPLGFTNIYGNGIYINENHNLLRAYNLNNKIREEILKDKELNSKTTYKAIIITLEEIINESTKYELSDIQVVKYENEKYRFNILSKQLLKIVNGCKEELNKLINAGFTEIKTYFRIYEEIMKKLMNNENLFLLIHKMLILELEQSKNKRFHIGHIKNVMNINFEYLKGVGIMSSISTKALKFYSSEGSKLKLAYKNKSAENKISGIAYKLLNALKTNNQGMFMDTILNCYLYTKNEVPNFLTNCLGELEEFKVIGYAFVSGLIDGKIENEDEKTNGGNE